MSAHTSRLLACAICLLLPFAGCKQTDGAVLDIGSKLADLTSPPADQGSEPDADPTPRILVRVLPGHLTAGWGTDGTVDLSIGRLGNLSLLDDTTVESQINQALSVMAAKTPVAGKLTFDFSSATIEAKFVPASSLTMDTEYVVRIKPLGYVVPQREYTSFHVGPLPRLRLIQFDRSTTKTTDLDVIAFTFSEFVSTAKVAAAVSVVAVGSGLKIAHTLVNTNQENSQIGIRVPAGTSLSNKLRITIGADVGAVSGLKLDGAYTGIPGSGDFSVELIPDQYVDPWVPPFTP